MYSDGYRGVQKGDTMFGQNATATAAAGIVLVAILFLAGVTFAFKGSVHF